MPAMPHKNNKWFQVKSMMEACDGSGDLSGVAPEDLKMIGYGKPVSNGMHFCLDIPDGPTGLIVRTSSGQLIRIAFHADADKPAQHVSIQTEDSTALLDIESAKKK